LKTSKKNGNKIVSQKNLDKCLKNSSKIWNLKFGQQNFFSEFNFFLKISKKNVNKIVSQQFWKK